MYNNLLQLSILNFHMETEIFSANRSANGPTKQGHDWKISCSILRDLVSYGFDPDFLYFLNQKRFPPAQWALHQPQISISKIELVTPKGLKRERIYAEWTARQLLWWRPYRHYSSCGVDSVRFGIYEVALNAWQSDGFTPVAAIGKKCVEPKQSSKALFPSSLWAVRAV